MRGHSQVQELDSDDLKLFPVVRPSENLALSSVLGFPGPTVKTHELTSQQCAKSSKCTVRGGGGISLLLLWSFNMDCVPGASAQCRGSAFSVWFPLHPSGTGLSSSSWKRERKQCVTSSKAGATVPTQPPQHLRKLSLRLLVSDPAKLWALALLSWCFLHQFPGGQMLGQVAHSMLRLTLPGPIAPASAPLPVCG